MYQALYRKWRPQTFNDVYGQNHITKTLKNELQTGRISHAYLFTGSRGTGKTTCAKILAKAVNCLNPIDGNPCNECEMCRGIDSGSILDVIEIDAASNNSVDNIRDLREEVNFTPANAKYRVYIIDEVHMLSMGAFNALLKTLEEPPAHVIFILATTDLHKLPSTILSRCQRFDFKRIAPEDIVARLTFIAQQEGVTITDAAANLIANIADGGMRDSLSLMDRCLSITSNIDENTVSDAAGVAGTKYMFEFSKYIAKAEFTESLKLVSKLHSESCDIEVLCTGLNEHFRNLMVAKTVSDCSGLIVCSGEELAKYKERANELKIGKILECIDILSETAKNIKNASNKKIQLEAAVIKMCGVSNAGNESGGNSSDLENRISVLENKLLQFETGNIVNSAVNVSREEPAAVKKEEVKPVTPAEMPEIANKRYANGLLTEWPDILEKVKLSDAPLFGMLLGTTALMHDGKIVIKTENPSLRDMIIRDSHYIELNKAVYEVMGKKIKMSVSCTQNQVQNKTGSALENLKDKIDKFNNN